MQVKYLALLLLTSCATIPTEQDRTLARLEAVEKRQIEDRKTIGWMADDVIWLRGMVLKLQREAGNP